MMDMPAMRQQREIEAMLEVYQKQIVRLQASYRKALKCGRQQEKEELGLFLDALNERIIVLEWVLQQRSSI